MDNDTAKELYTRAMGHFQAHRFDEALGIFDDLDRERPNSRHVMQHRALCLLRLSRIDEAQLVAAKLEGKLEPELLYDLRAKIAAAREAESEKAAQDSQADVRCDNVFVAEQVFPTSTTETTVTGYVKSGVFHQGDALTVVSPSGMPLIAPLQRIGKAETPLKIVRAGQSTVFLLQVEPHHVVPGSSLICAAQEESYAATMVVDSGSANAAAVAFLPELLELERLVKGGHYEEAHARLTAHVESQPESAGGHRLLARVYLEAQPPLSNPKKALEHIRKAYEQGGADDPAVVNVLADALAANGEAEHGLRFIERLHGAAQEPLARHALAKHIYEFRDKNRLGHVWEFCDDYGDVVFESGDLNEVVKALSSGTVAKTAKCRRDHAGDWRDAAELLSAAHPELARLYQSGKPRKAKGGGPNMVLIAVVAAVLVLVAATAAMMFIR